MKNWIILPIVGIVLLIGVGVGVMVQKRHNTYYNPSESSYVMPRKNDDGFHYRGLLLDIDTRGDKADINIGPQHYYRMGYQDGYYGYRINARYCDDSQYMRGYRAGQYDHKYSQRPR